MLKHKLAVHMGNYNGFTHRLQGKGRLVWTIETVLRFLPEFEKLDVTIVDNDSDDGSGEYLQSLTFPNVIVRERIIAHPSWLATTLNNMRNLGETILSTNKPYLWNIENCSWFYGDGAQLIQQALDVLDEHPDVSIIHLRRWTPMDAKDRPGAGRNYCRVKETRSTRSGEEFHVLERRDQDLIWIDVGDDFGKGFVPDAESGYGLHPVSETEAGGIRFTPDGSIEMLVEEHWGTYTSHGWIARTQDMQSIVRLYKPLSEREMSRCVRKHLTAARLSKDAFVDFGWRTRNGSYTEEDVFGTLEWAKSNNHSSVQDYGTFV